MSRGVGGFVELLDLEPIEVNIFRGARLEGSQSRVFGGQVAAQAIVAAGRTVETGRVHSLHAYFLRPGDPATPILYEVDRIHDGRSFTTRRVVATIQHGQASSSIWPARSTSKRRASWSTPERDAHRPRARTRCAGLSWSCRRISSVGSASLKFLDDIGILLRSTSSARCALGTRQQVVRSAEQLWLRAIAPPSRSRTTRSCTSSRIGDLRARSHPAVLRHDPSPATASLGLDNARLLRARASTPLHGSTRPLRADQWLFYDQTSPAAAGALGLSIGSLYQRGGQLVATVAQEGLVRIRPGTP